MDKASLAYGQLAELEMPGKDIVSQAHITGQAVTYLAEGQQSNSDQSNSTTPNQSKHLRSRGSLN